MYPHPTPTPHTHTPHNNNTLHTSGSSRLCLRMLANRKLSAHKLPGPGWRASTACVLNRMVLARGMGAANLQAQGSAMCRVR